MTIIQLNNNSWTIDETRQLGKAGGFGEVFVGAGPFGEVAIKRLKITAKESAYREMKMGEFLAEKNYKKVVPVLDCGHDVNTDRYYLVMPLCGDSLQNHRDKNASLEWLKVKSILLDIIDGLIEAGDIIHRDLKPDNILWHQNSWCLADFGIAKFVEDSTSQNTMKWTGSSQYAAPEQWKGETASKATDVYALGCVIHTLINGSPPFFDDDDVRKGHLEGVPPELQNADPRLNGFVKSMLRKPQESRPSVERCREVISAIQQNLPIGRLAVIATAGNIVATREAERDAEEEQIANALQRRRDLYQASKSDLERIMGELFSEISESAEAAYIDARHKTVLRFGKADLRYAPIEQISFDKIITTHGYWDIVSSSIISVNGPRTNQQRGQSHTYTFSASLVFATTPTDENYRWREVSFYHLGHSELEQPCALDCSSEADNFQLAVGHVMHSWQIAHGPLTIDAENEENFKDRWSRLISRAASHGIQRPDGLPLHMSFFD